MLCMCSLCTSENQQEDEQNTGSLKLHMGVVQLQHGLDQRENIDNFGPFAPQTLASPRTTTTTEELLKLKNLSNMIQDSNSIVVDEAQSNCNVKTEVSKTPLNEMCPLFSKTVSSQNCDKPSETHSHHLRNLRPKKPLKCNHCEFETFSFLDFKRHLKSHRENQPSKPKGIFDPQYPSNFVYRAQKQKGNKIVYNCNICKYSTLRKDNIVPHARTHTGEKPFKCRLCSYTAAQKSMVKIHERTHNKEKPFKCEFCSYSTAQDGHLKRHLISHTGLTIYKCQFCSYFTSRQENLKRHEARHTGEKPFKCKHCSYTSTQKIRVKIHERIHTGEKPHKCQQCPYSTNRDSNLRRHLKTHVNEAE